jgi:hypothetical protein
MNCSDGVQQRAPFGHRYPAAPAASERAGLIMTPQGATALPTTKPRPDEMLIKALVRAHRWRG